MKPSVKNESYTNLEEELNKDKAIQKLLNLLDEEFVKGAVSMLKYLQERTTNCHGKDRCIVCTDGNKYLKALRKKLEVKQNV